MSADALAQILLMAVPIILAVTLHEAAHGFVALHFGDDTAKNAGRVTLNPIKHIDPFGTIFLPLLLVVLNAGFVFGYAKPVPVNFAGLRNPRWDMIWVAAAGPGMNVLLALLSAGLLYGVVALEGGPVASIANMLLLSIELNFVLAVFNLLPLPPLDGSKILAPLLPQALAGPYLRFGRYGMTLLLLILVILPIIGARTGLGFDLFGWLVQRPADAATHAMLRFIGQN
jgi:Zn-dependent protease